MPTVDKPAWVQHDGHAIFSCDIHPDGSRLATSGNDSKVRIWTMGPILNHSQEQTSSIPKKVATLTEHNAPGVNIVRFSPDGKLLASGGDDQVLVIYRKLPGRGESAFGSGDGENIDNWKPVRVCRRHKSAVTGIAWSPLSDLVATCSLDTDAIVWSAATGDRVAVLSGHSNFVKGIDWDPINSYVATLSEDRTARLWSTDDWTCVGKISKGLEHMSTSTLFCRLAWSRMGDQLLVVNTADHGVMTMSMCGRENWEADHKDCVGHSGPVVAARSSPVVFVGKDPAGGDEEIGVQYFAAGSQDRSFSVWPQGSGKPLVVIKKGFKSAISDLAWSPDGMHLVVVSSDGSAMCVSFAPSELGKPMPHDKVEELMTHIYGDARGVTGDALLESAEMLAFEVENNQNSRSLANQAPAAVAPPAAAQAPPPPGADGTKTTQLSARLGPSADAAALAPAPRRPAPLAAGRVGAQGAPGPVSALKRGRPAGGATEASGPRVLPPADRSRAAGGDIIALDPNPRSEVVLTVRDEVDGAGRIGSERTLLASNSQRVQLGLCVSELVCSHQGEVLWSTSADSHVHALAGSPRFYAAALYDGTLLLFSPAGRRLTPPLALPAPAAFLASDNDARLLAVCTNGAVRVWDVPKLQVVLECTANAIARASPSSIAAAALSSGGAPLLTLANAHAFAFHQGLREWMRVADWGFPSSSYHGSFAAAEGSELGALMASAAAGRPTRALLNNSLRQPLQQRQQDSCSHLESAMAAAAALGSGRDWVNFLAQYVRLLAGQGDGRRLQELCDDLLGPLHWRPAPCPEDASGSGGAATSAAWTNADAAAWEPKALGHEKRLLLRDVVLPAMGSSRHMGRLSLDYGERLKQAMAFASEDAMAT